MSIGDINARHPDLLMAGRGLGQPAGMSLSRRRRLAMIRYHPGNHFWITLPGDSLGKSIGWRGWILFPSPAPAVEGSDGN